ncbi:hypothetical protein EMIT0P294_170082 [Pseudomonas sp. IT-P294]
MLFTQIAGAWADFYNSILPRREFGRIAVAANRLCVCASLGKQAENTVNTGKNAPVAAFGSGYRSAG